MPTGEAASVGCLYGMEWMQQEKITCKYIHKCSKKTE